MSDYKYRLETSRVCYQLPYVSAVKQAADSDHTSGVMGNRISIESCWLIHDVQPNCDSNATSSGGYAKGDVPGEPDIAGPGVSADLRRLCNQASN